MIVHQMPGRLKTIRLRNFKSWRDTGAVSLGALTVLFGPNTAGKSNFIDGVLLLSRLAGERTISDALGGPVRGRPIEAFRFESGGLQGLLEEGRATLELAADVVPADVAHPDRTLRYRVGVTLLPKTGEWILEDEYLAQLTARGTIRGTSTIERVDERIHIRRKGQAARPYQLERRNFTALSDRRFSGRGYELIESCRNVLSSVCAYYLDPHVAMRAANPGRGFGYWYARRTHSRFLISAKSD